MLQLIAAAGTGRSDPEEARRIEEVEGVSPTYAAELEAAGVSSTD